MTIGKKIKKIRTFRGMIQKEFGLAIGPEEKGADNRIAQYETNYRIPKRELLTQMAAVLRVSPMHFYSDAPGCAEDIMQTFFWLDEDNPGAINLFQLVHSPGKTNSSDDTAVRHNDNDDWPTHAPVGMYFKYGLVDQFMKEWLLRKAELKAGSITRTEYFEWTLGFPQTCDDCGKQKNALLNLSFMQSVFCSCGFYSVRYWRIGIVSSQYQVGRKQVTNPVSMRVCGICYSIPTRSL